LARLIAPRRAKSRSSSLLLSWPISLDLQELRIDRQRVQTDAHAGNGGIQRWSERASATWRAVVVLTPTPRAGIRIRRSSAPAQGQLMSALPALFRRWFWAARAPAPRKPRSDAEIGQPRLAVGAVDRKCAGFTSWWTRPRRCAIPRARRRSRSPAAGSAPAPSARR
jgi:hypothetical protein